MTEICRNGTQLMLVFPLMSLVRKIRAWVGVVFPHLWQFSRQPLGQMEKSHKLGSLSSLIGIIGAQMVWSICHVFQDRSLAKMRLSKRILGAFFILNFICIMQLEIQYVWKSVIVCIQIEIQINVKVFFINFPLENQSMGSGRKKWVLRKKQFNGRLKMQIFNPLYFHCLKLISICNEWVGKMLIWILSQAWVVGFEYSGFK